VSFGCVLKVVRQPMFSRLLGNHFLMVVRQPLLLRLLGNHCSGKIVRQSYL
jgi:hypothetical protein